MMFMIFAIIELANLAQRVFSIDFNYISTMTTKIEDIEANYEQILAIVGSDSYVNWESFTKSSTELVKSIDLLMQSLTVLKEIQQKRFITAMKKLKGSDIPDLIKTVKAKKLPREALKAVLSKFKVNEQGSIQLEGTTEALKEESKNTYDSYVNVNDILTNQIKETVTVVNTKIQESGLYEPPALPKELVSTFKHEFNPHLLEQIKKEIHIQPQPGTNGLFNIQTYGEIIHSTYEVVKDQYKRLTIESRKKQRQLIGNCKKYTEALMEYLTNTEVLIIEGQKAIVNKIGVGEKVMEASEVTLMESGLAQTIVFIQSGLRTKVKESVLPTKEVSVETTKEIIKYQIQSIPRNTPFFKQMLGGLERTNENFQLVPLLIALSLNDFVFQKFGFEQEDFMKNVTDQILFTNKEFANLFKEMEASIIRLMTDAGVINEDMARIMQIHSQQIQSQVAHVDPTSQGQNPQSGVFPGSDPMQLLQYRLNEQLNQVDKK